MPDWPDQQSLSEDDPQIRAKQAVFDYWNDDIRKIELYGIKTVWFAYILGGWKTLMFINDSPDNYFEVTYNAGKGEMYLDHYKKVHNEAIPDSSEYKMAQLRERLNRKKD